MGLAFAAAFALPSLPAHAACYGRDLLAYYRRAAPERLAAIEREAAAMPFAQGRLFRLTRPGTVPSFVFGTLHLVDPRLETLPPAILTALGASTTLALEFAIDDRGRPLRPISAADPALQAAPGDRADRLLPPAEFAALQKLVVAHGLPAAAASSLKPTVLALVLDLPACAADRGKRGAFPDAALERAARARGERVVGLETFSGQVAALDGLGPNDERALLSATLARAPFAADDVETSIQRYLRGEIGKLLAWTRGPILWPGQVQAPAPTAFLDRLLDRRTARFHRRAAPLVARGGVFVAVGAAHLPGANGLVRLFQEDGYSVTALDADP